MQYSWFKARSGRWGQPCEHRSLVLSAARRARAGLSEAVFSLLALVLAWDNYFADRVTVPFFPIILAVLSAKFAMPIFDVSFTRVTINEIQTI